MRKETIALAILLWAVLAPPAGAHHGFTGCYDASKVIRIEGKVRKLDFINPHGVLELDTVDGTGRHVVYVVDL